MNWIKTKDRIYNLSTIMYFFICPCQDNNRVLAMLRNGEVVTVNSFSNIEKAKQCLDFLWEDLTKKNAS